MTARFLLLVLGAAGATAESAAAVARSDILPPNRRQEVVELATALTRPPAPAPVPEDLPNPFNPPDFDKPTAEEAAAGIRTPVADTGPAQPPSPPGDREILEAIAARLVPSGTFIFRGAPQLIIGNKRFPLGTRFTVAYNEQDYELELVSIDRTTFTLRYRGEEITRPIKPVQ